MANIVVFDLGNVLIHWDREFLYRKLISDEAELRRFLDTVLTLEENAALDRGESLASLTARLTERHPADAELLAAFRDRWIETVGGLVEGSVELLEALRDRGVPLYALSNWGAETFAAVRDRYEWFEHFEGMVISSAEGMVKPEPEIFELMCARHGFAPADALFIDDSAANIDAAAALGFDTVLFTDADALRSELEARALLG